MIAVVENEGIEAGNAAIDTYWRDEVAAARAALSVLTLPTEAMWDAGEAAVLTHWALRKKTYAKSCAKAAWDAMIAEAVAAEAL